MPNLCKVSGRLDPLSPSSPSVSMHFTNIVTVLSVGLLGLMSRVQAEDYPIDLAIVDNSSGNGDKFCEFYCYRW